MRVLSVVALISVIALILTLWQFFRSLLGVGLILTFTLVYVSANTLITGFIIKYLFKLEDLELSDLLKTFGIANVITLSSSIIVTFIFIGIRTSSVIRNISVNGERLYDLTPVLILLTMIYLIAILALNWVIASFSIKSFGRQESKKAFQIGLVWLALSILGHIWFSSQVLTIKFSKFINLIFSPFLSFL